MSPSNSGLILFIQSVTGKHEAYRFFESEFVAFLERSGTIQEGKFFCYPEIGHVKETSPIAPKINWNQSTQRETIVVRNPMLSTEEYTRCSEQQSKSLSQSSTFSKGSFLSDDSDFTDDESTSEDLQCTGGENRKRAPSIQIQNKQQDLNVANRPKEVLASVQDGSFSSDTFTSDFEADSSDNDANKAIEENFKRIIEQDLEKQYRDEKEHNCRKQDCEKQDCEKQDCEKQDREKRDPNKQDNEKHESLLLELKASVAMKQMRTLRSVATTIESDLENDRLLRKLKFALENTNILREEGQFLSRDMVGADLESGTLAYQSNTKYATNPIINDNFEMDSSVLLIQKSANDIYKRFEASRLIEDSFIQEMESFCLSFGEELFKVKEIADSETDAVHTLNRELYIFRQQASVIENQILNLKSKIQLVSKQRRIRDVSDFELLKLTETLNKNSIDLQGITTVINQKETEIQNRNNLLRSSVYVISSLEPQLLDMCNKAELLITQEFSKVLSLEKKMEKHTHRSEKLSATIEENVALKKQIEKELDDAKKLDGSAMVGSTFVDDESAIFTAEELCILLDSRLSSIEATIIEENINLRYVKSFLTETQAILKNAETNVKKMKSTKIKLKHIRDKLPDGKKRTYGAVEGKSSEIAHNRYLENNSSEAQKIRMKPAKDQTQEERDWIYLDLQVNPHLYDFKDIQEVDVDKRLKELESIDIRRIMQLPTALHEAMPFFHTESEMRAHYLLNRFNSD